MKGSRPIQAALTQGNDLPKTAATQQVVESMVDGKIVNNWVSVDFAYVTQQLGVDPFQGHGWETFDRGEKQPPQLRQFNRSSLPESP